MCLKSLYWLYTIGNKGVSSLSLSHVCALCSSDCCKNQCKIGKLRNEMRMSIQAVHTMYTRVTSYKGCNWERGVFKISMYYQKMRVSHLHQHSHVTVRERCATNISHQRTFPYKNECNLRWERKRICHKILINLNHCMGGKQ